MDAPNAASNHIGCGCLYLVCALGGNEKIDAARFCAARLIQYFPGKCLEELACRLEVSELERTGQLPRQSEASFQAQVIELAQRLGWKVHAERPARTKDGWRTAIVGDRGWPDLVLVKANKDISGHWTGWTRVIHAELKSDTGHVSAGQQEWLDILWNPPAVFSFVWRPRDWDRIVAELSWPEEVK